ncbi:MAG: lysophospholipase L1-like esterase [Bryobacterales bacterium]|nr:lysophospholipase L1-like esterase [Bryobacterales bacterium]
MKQVVIALLALAAIPTAMLAAPEKWVLVWTGSTHGPYPAGNAVAQPDLSDVLRNNTAQDQTLRMVVKPGLWGHRVRLRFSNVFGSAPLTLDGVYVGIHASGGTILPGTNRPVRFNGGKASVTIAPGALLFSDPVDLNFAKPSADLRERKMAISFHVDGNSGPLTFHAKAMSTSYLSASGAGSHGGEESADAFPFTTTSWFVVDAVEAMAPSATRVVVGFGDSITDGTNSTINGDDRWPDFLAQRLRGFPGAPVVVVNAGIGGNQVLGPATYDKAKPFNGGPAALQRLERDVLSLAGVNIVIWLEAINDLGAPAATSEAVIAGYRQGVERMKQKGIRVIGATVTSALTTAIAAVTPDADKRRKAINDFIRTGKLFDAVADFDAATVDPQSGTLKLPFQPNVSVGGPGDRIHPNRAGYQAMANSIDLKTLFAR